MSRLARTLIAARLILWWERLAARAGGSRKSWSVPEKLRMWLLYLAGCSPPSPGAAPMSNQNR